MRRRTFLLASATVVAVAGCGPDSPGPGPSGVPGADQDPDAAVRSSVAVDEAALIAAYRATIQAFPELEADLAPLQAQHEEHLGRVDPSAPDPTSTDPTATTSPQPAGSPEPGTSTNPAASSAATTTAPTSARAAVAELADLETRARDQRTAACNRAAGSDLARTLCLIAGSEGQHAAALTTLARDLRA